MIQLAYLRMVKKSTLQNRKNKKSKIHKEKKKILTKNKIHEKKDIIPPIEQAQLLDLPNELLVRILDNLSFYRLAQIQTVCKFFYDIIRSDFFLKHLSIRYNIQHIQSPKNSDMYAALVDFCTIRQDYKDIHGKIHRNIPIYLTRIREIELKYPYRSTRPYGTIRYKYNYFDRILVFDDVNDKFYYKDNENKIYDLDNNGCPRYYRGRLEYYLLDV